MPEFEKIRRVLSCTRRAVDEYNMINDGDRIAVGVSGGKDSVTLLCALINLQRFYPKKFELMAVTVDMGFEGMDYSPLEKFCAECGIPFKLVHTQLGDLIFNVRKESNPCSLCARMRRGILHDACVAEGFNKIALGHHFDDAVETFMLNLFHEGRIGSFSPVTYLSRKQLTMIRPLIFTPEKDIRYFVNHNDLPKIVNLCPADGKTERETVKEMLSKMEREDKGLKHRIFGAMQKAGIDGYGTGSADMNKTDDDEI